MSAHIDMAHQFDNKVEEILRSTEASVAYVRATKIRAEQETKEFLRTGIAVIDSDFRNALEGCLNAKASTYFRTVAKESNRLPLIAEDTRVYVNGVGYIVSRAFTMPKQKRLKNVVAGMLLVAQECPTDTQAMQVEPVGRHDSAGTWRLYFNGAQGRDIFDEFRERCYTDPVMRCVLRLT